MIHRGANLSRCGTYRYTLTRRWADRGTTCLFVLLNPSTADALRDDPTIRRCIAFARSWGHAEMIVVNLFALRATAPRVLKAHAKPIGPRNTATLRQHAAAADLIVIAWGQHGTHRNRHRTVLKLLQPFAEKVHCLGRTKAGHPRHPLYIAANCPLLTWV